MTRSLCRAGNVLLHCCAKRAALRREPPREIRRRAAGRCAAGIGAYQRRSGQRRHGARVYLREGPLGQPRPLLALAHSPMRRHAMPGLDDMRNLPGWQRDHAIRIPFIGADAGFPSVPLRQRVARRGARQPAARPPGPGRRHRAGPRRPLCHPAVGQPRHHAGGGDQANILNGLLQQRTAVDLQPWLAALLSAASVGAAARPGCCSARATPCSSPWPARSWPWVFPGRCCSTAGGGRRWPAWSACCWPT